MSLILMLFMLSTLPSSFLFFCILLYFKVLPCRKYAHANFWLRTITPLAHLVFLDTKDSTTSIPTPYRLNEGQTLCTKVKSALFSPLTTKHNPITKLHKKRRKKPHHTSDKLPNKQTPLLRSFCQAKKPILRNLIQIHNTFRWGSAGWRSRKGLDLGGESFYRRTWRFVPKFGIVIDLRICYHHLGNYSSCMRCFVKHPRVVVRISLYTGKQVEIAA